MKIKSNTSLLLKQGLRSVFQFKIQFLIILILTFVGSMIISTAVATTRRLQSSYDQIVGQADKFESAMHFTVSDSSTKKYEDQLFLPIADFIPIEYTGFSDDKNIYNFSINADPTGNFIQKSLYEIITSGIYDVQDSWEGSAWSKEIINPNLKLWIDIIVKHLIFDLELFQQNNEIYLGNTLIGKYTLQNPDWYKKILGNEEPTLINIDKYNSPDNKQNCSEELKLLNYTFYMATSFAYYIYQTVWNINDIGIGSVFDAKSAGTIIELLFNSQSNQFTKILTKNTKIEDVENNIWGSISISEWQRMSEEDKWKFYKEIIGDENTSGKGFGGNVNPIVYLYDDEGYIVDFVSLEHAALEGFYSGKRKAPAALAQKDFGKSLSVFADEFTHISSSSDTFYSDRYDPELTTSANFLYTSAFLSHVKLAESATNVDVYFRKEAIINEPKSQIKYRVVSIDNNEDANFTILEGIRPTSSSEIAITEQFGRKNHLKIGDVINVNDNLFMITAYATDAYSFYSTADPDVPLPNAKNGTNLYVTNEAFQKIYNNGASKKSTTEYFNFFINTKNPEDEAKFHYYMNASKYSGYQNKNKINMNGKSALSSSDIVTFYQKIAFEDSPFSINWTLFIQIFDVFSSIIYSLTALIALIAIMSLMVCVVKTVQFCSKQVGIMKANGMGSKHVAISYISYSIVIALVAIPLGWIVGTMLQTPFVSIFSDYFSFPKGIWFVDWIAPVVAFIVFGILTAVVSYLTALLLVRKPVIQIIRKEDKWSKSVFGSWLNDKILYKTPFNVRFLVRVTSSGQRPIAFMIVFVFIASLFVFLGVLLPGVALYAKEKYYENIKYANTFDVNSPTANVPYTGDAITMWDGQKDNKMNSKEMNFENIDYYSDPNQYMNSVSNVAVFPQYVYDNDPSSTTIQSPYEQIIKNSTKGEDTSFNEMLNYIANQTGIASGKAISVGMIDQFMAYIFNLQNVPGSEEQITEQERVTLFNQILKPLTRVLSNILSVLIDREHDLSPNADWKEQFLSILLQQVPPYVKGYINTPEREEQFSWGFQTSNIVPGEETFATEINGSFGNFKNSNILGLDNVQDAYNLDKEAKANVFIDKKESTELDEVFKGNIPTEDITLSNGFKLYDKASKTITVPLVVNQQVSVVNKLNEGDVLKNFKTSQQQMYYRTADESLELLPREAWVYNDSDYKETSYASKTNAYKDTESIDGYLDENKNLLDPFGMDLNKFTYNIQVADGELSKGAYMFRDFNISDEGKISSSFIRPYYEWKNIELYIPYSKIDADMYNSFASAREKGQNVYTSVDNIDVPDFIRKAYGILPGDPTNWFKVRPYDMSIKDVNYANNFDVLVINNPYLFMTQSTRGYEYGPPKYDNQKLFTFKNEPVNYNENSINEVNFKVTDVVDIYGSDLMVIDSDIANSLLSMSNSRVTPYTTKIFNPTGDKTEQGTFDLYELDPNGTKPYVNTEAYKYTYIGTEDAYDYSPHAYYNKIISNVKEPLHLSSYVSLNLSNKIAGINLSLNNNLYSPNVYNPTLSAETKDLINQVITTALFVGIIIIISIVVASSLLIMLVGDIYIQEYRRFIVMMKSLGYSNRETMTYVLGFSAILAVVSWILATAAAVAIMYAAVAMLTAMGLVIPFGIPFWTILVCAVIIGLSYAGALSVSSMKVRKEKPSVLMNMSADE